MTIKELKDFINKINKNYDEVKIEDVFLNHDNELIIELENIKFKSKGEN